MYSTIWSKSINTSDLDLSLKPNKESFWKSFTLNDPIFDRTTKTSIDSSFPGTLIGNKAAHSYFGNGQTSKRTPKYPCTGREKAVTSRSRAISCDICDNWTHVKCTGNISNQKYDEIVKNDIAFSYMCNACITQSLPFQNQTTLPNDPENDLLINEPASKLENDRENIGNEFNTFRSKGLHFLGLNIRSLLSKLDQLKIFVQNNKPALICLSETWLDQSVTVNEIHLPGYSVERTDRNRQGGGVCIYVRDDLSYNARPDIQDEQIEGIWIDLLLPKTRPILIGSLYRPPKQNDFLDRFENMTKQVNFTQETYIFGDINICMLNKNTNSCKKYLDILKNNGFTQIIREPTRIENKESIIDHIICSSEDKISQSGVLPLGISDHLAIFCTRKGKKRCI